MFIPPPGWGNKQNRKTTGVFTGVRNFADFPFADRTFADGHLLIRHLLTGPGHLLTQTFANFSHPCHLLTLQGHLLSNNGDLLIQTYFTQDLKKSQEHAKRYHLKEQ